MFDLSNVINLPFVWSLLIGLTVFLYVLLDGFDLGVGILFPFAPSDKCRDRMMNSIAPFWDGNETWLVLGGGGLFAAFPLAYSILMPAFYMPLMMMLLALILRGVAFEFRFKAKKSKRLWDYVFHFGSLGASFFQGVILGTLVQGITVLDHSFSGAPFDWASGFSIMTGVALIFGYALLGSTWLIMKTKDITQDWARYVASYVLGFVAIFMGIVSICMPFLNLMIQEFWFSIPNFFFLAPIPILTILLFFCIWVDLYQQKAELRPFFGSIGIFFLAYLGLALSLFPWIVPFEFTIWEAASCGPTLSFLLVGAVPLFPLILSYTAYSYYIFRGKSTHEHMY